MSDGELAAFVRRKFLGAKKTGPFPPPRKEKPARSRADTTCQNCLEEGHSSQECTKPKVDVRDRRCFLCNQKGNSASRCSEGPSEAIDAGSASCSRA